MTPHDWSLGREAAELQQLWAEKSLDPHAGAEVPTAAVKVFTVQN